MNQKVVPFLLGMTVGFWGVRWVIHATYICAIIAAFALGKHFAV